MAIAIVTLALIALAFAVPNYVAIRYAVFGDSAAAPAVGGAAPGVALAPAAVRRKSRFAAMVRRAYLWKALSPIVFAVCVILGIGFGGAIGLSLVGVAALNLIFGCLGWDGYRPGR